MIDSGDTAWILTCSALVLMMTIPGLFLFYGGLVRSKNILGTILQSFIVVALISKIFFQSELPKLHLTVPPLLDNIGKEKSVGEQLGFDNKR